MLKWILFVVLGLVAFVAVLAVVGMFLPKGHRASRTVVYQAPPARVFATITDFARFPEWRSGVKTVELLGDDGRGLRFREDGANGVVTYRVERRVPDSTLVTRIDDPSLPYRRSVDARSEARAGRRVAHDHRGWRGLQPDLPRHVEGDLLPLHDDRHVSGGLAETPGPAGLSFACW